MSLKLNQFGMIVVHWVLYLNEGMIVAATLLRILSWGSVDLDGMARMLVKDFNSHKVPMT